MKPMSAAKVRVCSNRPMKTTLGDYYLPVNIITAAQVRVIPTLGGVCVCSLL